VLKRFVTERDFLAYPNKHVKGDSASTNKDAIVKNMKMISAILSEVHPSACLGKLATIMALTTIAAEHRDSWKLNPKAKSAWATEYSGRVRTMCQHAHKVLGRAKVPKWFQ
ncbi:unnamed protein product, partial [Prorocentrum cordatum]